jgi:hypothetical protein
MSGMVEGLDSGKKGMDVGKDREGGIWMCHEGYEWVCRGMSGRR